MSILFRAQEQRGFDEPPIPRNSERGRQSIRRVDLSTAEGSMQKVAVASSVRLLASILSTIPLHTYTGSGENRRRITAPRWLDDLGGDGYGLPDWIASGVYSAGLRGNLYGIVPDRDPSTGKPRQIILEHPDDVTVRRDADGLPDWRVRGKKIDTSRVFHRRIYPIPGCIKGPSPVGQHALTIGTGLAAEQFGAQFFLDGGHPTAVFQNKVKKIDPKQAKVIKRRLAAAMRGNREPIVVGADWDYKAIQVSPSDSQFLETNKYTSAECARIYGPGMPAVLGYETGGSMTYQNLEQFNSQLLTFTFDPWFVWFERLLSSLLPQPQFVQFERKALLRTDILTRFKVHEIALRNRIEVVNEVRDIEDMPPVDWGHEPNSGGAAPAPIPVTMEG